MNTEVDEDDGQTRLVSGSRRGSPVRARQTEEDLLTRVFSLVVVRWARQDLNLQPTDYESAALTRLSYGPVSRPEYRANTGNSAPRWRIRSADENSPTPLA